MACPVQTRMPVAVGERRECQGLRNLVSRQQTCRRRVFVQTDSGSVLGIELDRADNAQTVKKKMQLALNVPTEESALTFGDTILKNDLSVVRNDAPLRLTRSVFHRSSSTPCFSLSSDGAAQQQGGDKSGPLEIVGGLSCCDIMRKLIKQCVKAIERGVDPVPANGGLGGAYFFRNVRGENIAIVKPTDEEPLAPNNPKGFVGKCLGLPGLKGSVRVGETGIREVAAHLLDHARFAKVPPTILVKISHSIFNVNSPVMAPTPKILDAGAQNQPVSKIASFQQFVTHDFDASDHGTSSYSVSAVHRIGILDVRILNTDRHGGNILVKRGTQRDFSRYSQVGEVLELIPIDHGLCLPETMDDPYFEWLHWPQASLPFSDEELQYIERLDANSDADMLRMVLPMLRESSLRILVLCTVFLKIAAKSGLCLAEIGEMMSRGIEEASELELICLQAKVMVDEPMSPQTEFIQDSSESVAEKEFWLGPFELEMEYQNEGLQKSSCFKNCDQNGDTSAGADALIRPQKGLADHSSFKPSSLACGVLGSNSPDEASVAFNGPSAIHLSSSRPSPGNPRMPFSFDCSSSRAPWKGISMEGISASRPTKSGHELGMVASKGISFSEMSEREWALFLKCFQELLPEAIALRKRRTSTQRHRLGISCQF
eukprot:TRINITY_DN1449_c0_g1_i1.p1 TRINITY_DN1449_c0_g1~~TRINITY_DN1449_c0_g1_i1.p1  ORF type:complete len:657 (-),score=112.61 TRINITY_DN1449_c0_g1_i1:331-2301(-)